jgi:hypothetical protein
MNESSLIYPMFAMVLLTVVILARLFRSRVQAVKDGQVSAAFFRTYQGEVEPELSAKLSRQFNNLFEAPVLFYVACLAAMVTHQVTLPFLSLAWSYVIARVLHAYIHVGGNRLGKRIKAYMLSWLVLLLMWVYLIVLITIA